MFYKVIQHEGVDYLLYELQTMFDCVQANNEWVMVYSWINCSVLSCHLQTICSSTDKTHGDVYINMNVESGHDNKIFWRYAFSQHTFYLQNFATILLKGFS